MTGPFPPGPPQQPPGDPYNPGGYPPPGPPQAPQAPAPGYGPAQQPGYQQPGYQQPGYQQPGYQQPGYQQGQGYGPGPATGYPPPGPGYAPQPGYQPRPAPPARSGAGKGCLIAFLVVLALVIVAVVVIAIFFGSLFGGILDFGQKVVENATTVGDPAGHLGDTVEIEGTQFVVHSVDCGKSAAQVGGTPGTPAAPDTSSPTDQFCIAKISVKNVGSGAMVLTGTEAQAFMSRDDTNPVQSMPSFDNGTVLGGLGDLNPGQSTDIDYLFEVPQGAKPRYLKLHAGFGDPTSTGRAGSGLPGPLGPGVTVDVGN